MNKKLFWALWGMGVVGTIASIPYAFMLQESVIARAPISVPALVAVSIVQTAVLLAIVVYLGLRAAKAVGLGALYLEKRLAGEKTEGFGRVAAVSALVGAIAGILIVADALFAVLPLGPTDVRIPAAYRLLASLYGGITEELLLRLFLMSVIAWLIVKLSRRETGSGAMWTAIVVSSVVFGVAHLPATAALTAITPLIVARAIVLNGIGGIAFGWLYWKRGLESAMVAHFAADIVLHGIVPLFA